MSIPPPAIPVRPTVKSTYKPISRLNGDDLPKLRRLKKAEFTGSTSCYSTFSRRILANQLNVWHRQHHHTLETLRKEQLQVYHVMCRVQREKRRVQRDEHEELRKEIRRLFYRQRKRQLLRRVIAKFRENVIRKRIEREAEEVQETQTQVFEAVQSVASKFKAKVNQSSVQPESTVSKELETASDPSASPSDQNKTLQVNQTQSKVKRHSLSGINATESGRRKSLPVIPEGRTTQTSQGRSRGQRSGLASSSTSSLPVTYSETPLDDTEFMTQLQSQNKSGMSIPEVSTRTPNTSSPSPLLAANKEDQSKHYSSLTLPPKPNYACDPISQVTKANETQTLAPTSNELFTSQDMQKSPVKSNPSPLTPTHGPHFDCVRHTNKQHDIVSGDAKFFNATNSVNGIHIVTPIVQFQDHNESASSQQEIASQMTSPRDKEVEGQERHRNLVKNLKKEEIRKMKERADLLDNETIVRYSRKPYEDVKPMYGFPRRPPIEPPSQKLRHEQDKLIREEHAVEVERQIRIESFFADVFKPKDDVGKMKLPKEDDSNKTKKETLSLAGVLSGLFSVKLSDAPSNKLSLRDKFKRLESCQYLRVPRHDLGDRDQRNRVTSWDAAEKSLRTGFGAFGFKK